MGNSGIFCLTGYNVLVFSQILAFLLNDFASFSITNVALYFVEIGLHGVCFRTCFSVCLVHSLYRNNFIATTIGIFAKKALTTLLFLTYSLISAAFILDVSIKKYLECIYKKYFSVPRLRIWTRSWTLLLRCFTTAAESGRTGHPPSRTPA